MMELFLAWGPVGLAAAAFLAGSVFPLPSEAVLGALVAARVEPSGLVLLASVANTFGAATLVVLGRRGRPYAEQKIGAARLAAFERTFEKYGVVLLLFGFLPVAGDAFIVIAGLLGVRWFVILPLVFLGKAARYTAVAWGAHALIGA